MMVPTTSSIAVSFIVPVFNDPRVVDCVKHLSEYIRLRGLAAEIIISGKFGNRRNIAGATYISTVPPIKGNAVRMGIMFSVGRTVCVCDSDMRPLFTDLDLLLGALKHSEVALGSRIDALSKCDYRPPSFRRLASVTYRWLVRQMFGWKNIDTQFGLKAFRKSAASCLMHSQIVQGFAYDVEVIYRAHAYGYRIVSVPVNWRWHPNSTLHLHRAAPKMFADTICLWFRRKAILRNMANHALNSDAPRTGAPVS